MKHLAVDDINVPNTGPHALAEVLFNAVELGRVEPDSIIPDLLHALRGHLGMGVAFISQFNNGHRNFRYIDSASANPPIAIGISEPLSETYCQRVVDGRLPELIPDAMESLVFLEVPDSKGFPVRAHLSVPIRLSDGEIYGTLCCFNTEPMKHSLDARDLGMMKAFADFSARQIEQQLDTERCRERSVGRIRGVLDDSSYTIHYQPIYHVAKNIIIGFESLTRFQAEPIRSPDLWFKEAEEAGLSEELEMAVIRTALEALDCFPENVYITLNVSPKNILNGAVTRTLAGVDLERCVLEITEHEVVTEYSALVSKLKPLRGQGLRLAIDDVGAGHSSFRHIIQLRPDMIKLDLNLIRDIDTDENRRALAAAIIGFARETSCSVVAEGVETASEMTALRNLGVSKAQGYFLGRPSDLRAACKLLTQ